jgi:hypothetical protein
MSKYDNAQDDARAEVQGLLDRAEERAQILASRLEIADERVKQFEETLQFYANRANFEHLDEDEIATHGCVSRMEFDMGDRARSALSDDRETRVGANRG